MEALCPYYWVKGVPEKSKKKTRKVHDDGSSGPLTQRMRDETLQVHSTSDKLVNMKLVVAFTDRRLYGLALLRFYVIFRTLKTLSMPHVRESQSFETLRVHLDTVLFSRVQAFEADLDFYFHAGWSDQLEEAQKMPSVASYVQHLENLEREDPRLLIPYMYHLSLAILSGGQMMRRLVRRAFSLSSDRGMAVLTFDGTLDGTWTGTTKATIKAGFKHAVDAMSASWTEELRQRVVAGSVDVFKRNNILVSALDLNRPWWCIPALILGGVVLAMVVSWLAM